MRETEREKEKQILLFSMFSKFRFLCVIFWQCCQQEQMLLQKLQGKTNKQTNMNECKQTNKRKHKNKNIVN